MARKGRDLFEVLRERSASGRSAAGAPSSAGAEIAKVGRDVADWVRRKVGKEPPAPEPPPSRLGQNGLVLAAVAAIALILGFVVGRTTAGSGVDDGQLRRSESGPASGAPNIGPGTAPGVVGASGVRALNEREMQESLSTRGFPLLFFPAPERQKAFDLATWLRENGVETTRVKPVFDEATGEPFFFVISYVVDRPGARESEVLGRLKALAGSDRAPESLPPGALAREIARLGAAEDVTYSN